MELTVENLAKFIGSQRIALATLAIDSAGSVRLLMTLSRVPEGTINKAALAGTIFPEYRVITRVVDCPEKEEFFDFARLSDAIQCYERESHELNSLACVLASYPD